MGGTAKNTAPTHRLQQLRQGDPLFQRLALAGCCPPPPKNIEGLVGWRWVIGRGMTFSLSRIATKLQWTMPCRQCNSKPCIRP
jgi:hypothetical protein